MSVMSNVYAIPSFFLLSFFEAVKMAEPWDRDGNSCFWTLEHIQKKKTYRLKKKVIDGICGTISRCEEQEKWNELLERRTKEDCDLGLLVKDGEEYVHSKVLLSLSKMIKGVALLTVHKKRLQIDCSRFSSSSIRSLIKWAYTAELSFLENDLLDLFGAISFLGFERLYCRLIKAAIGEGWEREYDKPKAPEILRIEDKKIVAQLLGIIADKTFTHVPDHFLWPYSSDLISSISGTMQDGKEKIHQKVGSLNWHAIRVIAEYGDVEFSCCSDWEERRKKAVKTSIKVINIVIMWLRNVKENVRYAREIIQKMKTGSREEEEFKKRLIGLVSREGTVVWVEERYAIKWRKHGKKTIETAYIDKEESKKKDEDSYSD